MSARNTFAATRRSHAILQRLQRGEGVTIGEVSEEFGVQYPQARADLKLLEELYDLTTYRDGRTKVWQMPGANSPQADVGIAAALELGGVALDVFKHTPYGEYIDMLAETWKQRLSPDASQRLQRLSSALVLRRTWLPMDKLHMLEMLEDLLDAIRLQRGVELEYERSDGEARQYLLIPRRLIWYQDRLWLQAVDDGEQKLFDVAGILTISNLSRQKIVASLLRLRKDRSTSDEPADSADSAETDEAMVKAIESEVDDWFAYGSREEEDAFFSGTFGIFANNFESQSVELVVRNSWANYLRRYRIHPSQQNEETEEGLRVRFEMGLCPEFKSFILGMIPDVDVLGPQQLRDELTRRVKDWVS